MAHTAGCCGHPGTLDPSVRKSRFQCRVSGRGVGTFNLQRWIGKEVWLARTSAPLQPCFLLSDSTKWVGQFFSMRSKPCCLLFRLISRNVYKGLLLPDIIPCCFVHLPWPCRLNSISLLTRFVHCHFDCALCIHCVFLAQAFFHQYFDFYPQGSSFSFVFCGHRRMWLPVWSLLISV